ncbi:MAG TPA: GntR family transcriptional regulator [Thermoleophilaceae bacterium]|nr:GntR family transcriptional regulator [Thermoleophilaceae bacterium]
MALARTTTVDVLADAVRERILAGELAPGQRLIERDLVETYDVARGTVRAALRQLQNEGLVTVETHRGAFVRQLDDQALRELFELRTALEMESAYRALTANGGKLPPPVHQAVERLAAACERRRPSWQRIAAAHSDVHESIVAAGGSARIEAAYRQLQQELTLFLLALRPVWTTEEMAEQHRRLVRELESEGPAALRRHLQEGEAAVVSSGFRVSS